VSIASAYEIQTSQSNQVNQMTHIEAMKQALEALEYDKETGEFWWNEKATPKMRGKKAGNQLKRGHIQIKVGGDVYYAHRLAWFFVYGELPTKLIDHIDCNPANNRISNLREATDSINQQNKINARKDNKSGFLGVSQRSDGYQACIRANGKKKYLGLFRTAELAHQAYLTAKKQFHEGAANV